MSKEIDERVVEMRFDNKQFEKNVATTMNTVDKLKEKLKFSNSSSGFEKLQNAASKVSFNSMTKSIDTVKVKLSSLQVAGMTVISNITNTLLSTAKKFTSTIPTLISEGGKARALNIEQAKFQFKGLGMSVEKSMASANEAVKGTAYGLDSAAKVASQLGASGMKAGKDMTKSLRAVAGVAAMTGSSYDEIGQIFTTVSGNGRLMTEQLQQMSGRGLNAAASLAKYFNSSKDRMDEFYKLYTESAKKSNAKISKGAKATEANIRTMVTNGAIDFQTFSDAMDYAFGDHAKDADKTFTGAMSNVKAALSRIGAEFASPAYENFRKVFNSLIPVIDDVHVALMPVIKDITKVMKQARKFTVKNLKGLKIDSSKNTVNSKAWKELTKSGVTSKTFRKALINAAKEHDINVNKMIKKEGSFRKTLKNGWLSMEILKDALSKYNTKSSKVTKTATINLEKYKKVANDVISGKYGNGEARIKALTKAGYKYATVQSIVNNKLTGSKIKIEKLSKVQVKHNKYTKKQVKELKKLQKQAKATGTPLNKLIQNLNKPTTFELFIDTLRNIPKVLKSMGKAVKKAYDSIFPEKSSIQIYGIIEAVHDFSEDLINNADVIDKVKRTFAGLFAAIDIVRTIVSGGLRFAFNILANILGITNVDILSITASIGDAIVAFRKWLYNDSKFAKAIKTVAKLLESATKKIGEWIQKVKDASIVQEIVKDIKNIVTKAFSGIKKGAENCKDVIDKLVDSIGNLKLSSISDLKNNIGDAIKYIGNYFGKGKNLVSGFIDFCNDKLGIDLGRIIEFGAVLGAAKAIKKLVKSISGLFSIGDSVKGVLGGVKNVLVEYQKNIKTDRITKIAVSIGILAGAVAILSMLDFKKVRNAAIVLGLLAAEILSFTAVIGKTSSVNDAKISGTMLSLSASLLIMVVSLKMLGDVNLDNISKQMVVLGALFGTLVTMFLVVNRNSGETTKGAILMIGIATSIRILVGALKKLSKLKINASMVDGLLLIVPTLSLIALSASKMQKGSGLGILAIAIALRIMIKTIDKIADLDTKKIKNNIANFAVVIGAVMAIIASTWLAGKNATKAGVAVLAVAVALKLMVGVIKSLANMNNGDIIKGMSVIAVLILLFDSVIVATKVAGPNAKTVVGALMGMAVAIGLLVGIIKIVGAMKFTEMAQGLLCVTVLGAILGGIIALTYFSKECTATLIAIAGCIAVLTGVVFLLTQIPFEKMGSVVVGLGSITAVIAILTVLTEKMSITKKAVGALTMMTLVIYALVGVIYLLKDIPIKTTSTIAKSLSEMLISLSLVTVILSKFSGSAAGALKGIEALGVVLAGLTGILVVAGALNQIPGFSWLIGEGAEVLGQIGYAIGNFVGNIIGGFSAGASSGLPEIGNNLSKFMTNAKTFIDGAKSIDKSAATGIKSLCSAVLELTATKFLDGIANFLGIDTSFEDFGDKISSFGPALKKFQESTADLDTKSVEKSAKATEALVKVANELPKTEGVLGWLKGQDDLGSFGDKLSAFGKGIVKYAKSVSEIKDFSPITKSAKATKSLVEIAKELPNTEGFWGWVSGKQNLGEFGNYLKPFGEGLKSFINSLEGIKDFGIVSKATTSIGALVELSDIISDKGDINVSPLSKFIMDVNTDVVPVLKDFNNSTKDIDANKANTISEFMVHMMIVAQNAMSISTKGLKTFASELPNIGSNLATYYSNIKKISAIKLVAVASALTALSNTSKTISGSDTNGIKDFISSFEHIGTDGITKFIGSLGKSSGKAKYAITKLFKNLCSTVDSLKISLHSKMNAAGSYAVDGFVKGIKANDYKAAASAKVMAEKAEKAAKKALDEHSPSKVFQEIGAFTVLGYVKGVDKNRDKAINATYKMCKKIVSFSKRIFKATTNEMITGSGVFKTLTNSFFGEFKKNLKPKEIAKVYKSASKAVSDYAFQLYKESGQYKEDNKTANKHRKELQKLYAEREKLRSKKVISDKKSKKASEEAAQAESKASKVSSKKHKQEAKEAKKNAQTTKKSATEAKKQSENLKKSLKENAKNIKAKKKELIKDQKDVAKNIASTLKEIKTDIADSVKDFTDPFKASLDTGIELFEKFDKGTRMSTSRILRYMKSQVEGVSKWRENLEELSSKGFSAGFIDKLREMGSSSSNIVKSLLSMSAEDIKQVNAYYKKSQELSGDTFMDNFDLSMDKANQWSKNLKKLAKKGLSQDALEALGSLGVEGSSEYIDALLRMTPKQIKKFNKKYKKYLKLDDTIANQVVATYAYAGSQGLKALQKNLSKKNTKKISKNVCTGLATGIKKNQSVPIKAAEDMGKGVIKVVYKTLKIHSPSKVMSEAGMYAAKGLAEGMDDGSSLVQNSSDSLTDNMVLTMWNALEQIYDMVNNGIDTEPTIRPVLDLSSIEKGTATLDTMFSKEYASGINTNPYRIKDADVSGNAIGGKNYSYTQIINSPKPVSRIDIYRDTSQLLRRKATV